jgi:hypothetical protein
MFCGNTVFVQKAIQAYSGVSTENYFKLASAGARAGNYTEAYTYYTRILEIEPENPDAWLGKAESAAWSSTLRDFRVPEMISGFLNAVEFAPEEDRAKVKRSATKAINSVVSGLFPLASNHLIEFVALDNTWNEYLHQSSLLLKALETAHEFVPSDRATIENIIHICTVNVQGIKFNDPYNNNMSRVLYLSDQYEAELRKMISKYSFKMRKIDPSFQTPNVKRQTPSACFIATATMDDYNHPDVRTLRRFRDSFLLTSRYGRKFVRAYYSVGPYPARVINSNPALKPISAFAFVKPIARIAYFILKFRPRN